VLDPATSRKDIHTLGTIWYYSFDLTRYSTLYDGYPCVIRRTFNGSIWHIGYKTIGLALGHGSERQ